MPQDVDMARQAGAPTGVDPSSLNVLRSLPDPRRGERASPRAPSQVPVVWVSVLGRRLALPEPALSAGLSDFRLATEGCGGVADYAVGVALVLEALARNGSLAV